MRNDFRQPKFFNESGSKKGQYFINRFDYFEFHQYPNYKRDKILSVLGCVLAIYLIGFTNEFSGIIGFLYGLSCLYLFCTSIATFVILKRQLCKIRGYLGYPSSWVKFFRSLEKEIDVNDFDSIATMNDKP